MPRKKTNTANLLNGVDLIEFKRQKVLIEQGANEALAVLVEKVRETVREMQTIVDTTGVGINIQGLLSDLEESRGTLDPDTDWNSSSAYC